VSDEKRGADEQQPSVEAKATKKRPYHKSSFRYETVFETMALSCGNMVAGSACIMNKKTS
jgi:hypothetical protein